VIVFTPRNIRVSLKPLAPCLHSLIDHVMTKRVLLPHSYAATDEPLKMGSAKHAKLGNEIRCLVWNIWKAKRKGWLEGFMQLSAEHDLMMLQEAVTNAPTDPFFKNHKRVEWMMALSHRHPRSGVDTGVKTGCIATSISSNRYASPQSEPVVKTKKMLLDTRYQLSDGKQLAVLNMHAINFVSNNKFTAHLEQVAAAIKQHAGPVILAGDFNTWNHFRWNHLNEVAAHAGLIEATMQRKAKPAHLNKHLDHVFYRGLKLRCIESLEHVKLSDHAPITITFEQESE